MVGMPITQQGEGLKEAEEDMDDLNDGEDVVSIDFCDTFLDKAHIQESFGCTVEVVENEEKDTKEKTRSKKGKSKAGQLPQEDGEHKSNQNDRVGYTLKMVRSEDAVANGECRGDVTVVARATRNINMGPYPVDRPKTNKYVLSSEVVLLLSFSSVVALLLLCNYL